MKAKLKVLIALFIAGLFSAQQMNEYQFGMPFTMSYPIGYVKSYDLNDVAAAQFSSPVNEKYSIVIQTEKDNLTFFQLAFSNLVEAGDYYSKSIKDGLKDDQFLKYTNPKQLTINGESAVESTVEGTFSDDGSSSLSTQLYYHITIVETAKHYYQILSWCALKDKDKNVEEFRKIAKTFKENK